MKPESKIIGGVELPRWPPFSGAFRKDAQSAAKTYRGLCLARLTLFKSDRLNDRFEELALTQTFNKVTLYHFFYLMIPAGFLGACSVMALGCSSLPVRVVICSAGIGVGVLFAHLLPRFLWHMLGVYERKGWFLMEDDKAVRFFRELAERGSSFAQAALGFRHEHGQGVPKDVHAAFNWYRRSAAQGGDLGKYLLASLYETGSGVNQDRVEAYKWYLLSFTKRLPDELQAHAAAMTADQIAEAEQRAAAFVPEMEPAPPVEPSTRRVPIISVFSVVVLLCYTFLTVQIAYNLNLLERHETADYIPSLVYSIYLNHGYWPAVLATPCLGAALFGLYFWGLPFIGRVCGRWRP